MAVRGVNKVILLGNLGQDPESRTSPNGMTMASVSVATNESWTDKQTGQLQERTEWHRVVFFNRLAEIVGQYLRKGSQIYVEGRLQTRKYQDQQGQDRWTTDIVASEMLMLGGRQDNAAAPYAPPPMPGGGGSNYYAPPSPPAQQYGGAPTPPPAQQYGGAPTPPPSYERAYTPPPAGGAGVPPPPPGGGMPSSPPPPKTGGGFDDDIPF